MAADNSVLTHPKTYLSTRVSSVGSAIIAGVSACVECDRVEQVFINCLFKKLTLNFF